MLTKLAAAVAFWIAVGLIQKLDWGLGVYKAVVLALLLAAAPLAVARARGAARAPRRTSRALVIAVAALLALQTGYAVKELHRPSLIDAATTTLAAGTALRAGADPYAVALDSAAEGTTRDARFAGYKYLPVTLAAYLPLGAALGARGIALTNLLLHLVTVWLILRLGVRLGGAPEAGWIAALLYLALPLVPFQLFAKGVTDPVAIVPLLAALLLVERHALLSGFCLGLSLAAKLLPAALLLPCCLPATPRERMSYGIGVGLGLLPILPFLLWSPAALVDNVIVFNLARPADSTSWLFAAPSFAPLLAHGLAGAFFLAVAVQVWRRPPDLATRAGLGLMLILAAILAGPAAHHNYQLWWLPLAAALLGAALNPRALPSAAGSL